MRCVARAGLLALAGCNQIFGLVPTEVFDAAVDTPPPLPNVELTWQIAQVRETGAPDSTLQYLAITPAPTVRIATFAGKFGDDTTTYATTGKIDIPRSYLDQPWRLEYTLTDGIPREVQWDPVESDARVTVPMFGRLERAAVPTGGGYEITPIFPAPYSYKLPRVLTTGLWTEGIVTSPPSGPDQLTLDYDFASAGSLSGAKGRPDDSRGDRALLVDYDVDPDTRCRVALGAAGFSPNLTPNTHHAVSPSWEVTKRTVAIEGLIPDKDTDPDMRFEHFGRLTSTLGTLGGPTATGNVVIGRAAGVAMPGLTQPADALLLPAPAMHTLVSCPYLVEKLPDVLAPASLTPFPMLAHLQVTSTRTVRAGINLTSGMETVLTNTGTDDMPQFTVLFPAAIPTQIKLATPALGEVAIDGAADQLPIGPPAGTFILRFMPEAGPNARNDYYDVYLRRINGTALVTERIYTVASPSVQIDGALLAAGVEYVFEIRSYLGHPSAARGNFSLVTYPYGSAVVFTRTVIAN